MLPSLTMERKRRTHTLTKSLLNHKRYLLAHFCAASEGQEVHPLIFCHCCPAQWDTKHCVQHKTHRQKSTSHFPHASASTREIFKARDTSLKHQVTKPMVGKLLLSQKRGTTLFPSTFSGQKSIICSNTEIQSKVYQEISSNCYDP